MGRTGGGESLLYVLRNYSVVNINSSLTMKNVCRSITVCGFSYYLKFVTSASIFQNLREGLMLKKKIMVKQNLHNDNLGFISMCILM